MNNNPNRCKAGRVPLVRATARRFRSGCACSPQSNRSGRSSATLIVSHFWGVESFDGELDIMRIQLSSDNGSSWTTGLQRDGRDNNPSSCVVGDIDVSNLATSRFRVPFQFDSVDGVANNFLGRHVDSVEVVAQ